MVRALNAAALAVAAVFIGSPASAGLFGSTPQVDQATALATHETIEQLTRDVEHMHPVAMFVLAKRQFDAGNLDEAQFWYYEGKIRWLAYLHNNPALEGGLNEGGRFDTFQQDISPDIDWCAAEDVPNYLKIVNRALDWDAAHPDDFTPNDSAAKQSVREGLKGLLARTAAQADAIKQAHAEKLRTCPIAGIKDKDNPYSGNGGALFGNPGGMVSSYDPKRFDAFRVGSTTKEQVVESLGAPEAWTTGDDGTSTLMYSYDMPALPVLGMSQRVIVSFTFNGKKILTAVELPKDKTP